MKHHWAPSCRAETKHTTAWPSANWRIGGCCVRQVASRSGQREAK